MKELQKIDCNCSDCKHMDRSLLKRQESVDKHYRWQKDHFDGRRIRLLRKAEDHENKGYPDKARVLIKEARKMKFQFDESECAIHYGDCTKLEKDVSFIPNVCQLDTQECFEHRKS